MYNEKEKSFIYKAFMFFSLVFSLFCYLNIDPMKSCLFLILSLLFLSPFLSFGNEIWFSYFVCMVFLSGIFVILVYFSSLSKYNFFVFSFSIFIFFGVFFFPFFIYSSFSLKLFSLYYLNYIFYFYWVVFSLFIFMNFTSYFLNFSGALRKI